MQLRFKLFIASTPKIEGQFRSAILLCYSSLEIWNFIFEFKLKFEIFEIKFH